MASSVENPRCSGEVDRNNSQFPERTIGASTVAFRNRLLFAGAGHGTGVSSHGRFAGSMDAEGEPMRLLFRDDPSLAKTVESKSRMPEMETIRVSRTRRP